MSYFLCWFGWNDVAIEADTTIQTIGLYIFGFSFNIQFYGKILNKVPVKENWKENLSVERRQII